MFYDIYYVILDIFSLFVAPHSKEEQGSQEDVGCLLNFFPQVILDTFYMIFMFLLRGGIPKKSKAVGWRRLPHSLALLGLTFPFAQGQPALPYHHHHLWFFSSFLTTIIPENHHFFSRAMIIKDNHFFIVVIITSIVFNFILQTLLLCLQYQPKDLL